ncbi:hypothetical protein Y032_0145g2495 [Ancylostoma ceylanicum]|uniref:Uncharacterized protein n=2 Tax=Ancylostoma ceylanicum TaxID=53326 RepID=A0A016T2N2_9BILA|nr:hypothetical protein Y032_0145g2495 [Ancylostoma ceylanicum]
MRRRCYSFLDISDNLCDQSTSNPDKVVRIDAGITDRVVSERPSTREEPEILIVEPPFNVEAFGRKNIAFTSSAKKRKATGDRSFVEGENCVVYESPAPKQVKKLKQMRKSADMTAAKRSSSSEACSNRDYVDLEAMLSRRRFADWSWDIEEVNVAPASKRLRSDDDIKLAKDNEIWCDAQVQPSCDVKMDVDVNNHDQVLEVKV